MSAGSSAPAGSVRVLLVDDHRSMLWGLERLLESAPGFHVCATATSGEQALRECERTRPDVVLLDLDLGAESSAGYVGRLVAQGAHVLVFTGTRDPALHDRAILAGACGIVSKADPPETLLKAIEKASAGEMWLDRTATARLFRTMAGRANPDSADADQRRIASLTARERHVVAEMVRDAGASSRDIAARLHISEHTLRNHLTSIYDKLGLASRLELWAYANKHGLGPPAG